MRLAWLAFKQFFVCQLIGHRWRTQDATIGGFHLVGTPQCTRCFTTAASPSNSKE